MMNLEYRAFIKKMRQPVYYPEVSSRLVLMDTRWMKQVDSVLPRREDIMRGAIAFTFTLNRYNYC